MIPLVLKIYLMLLNRFFVIFTICLTSCVSLDSTFPTNLSFTKNVDEKFINILGFKLKQEKDFNKNLSVISTNSREKILYGGDGLRAQQKEIFFSVQFVLDGNELQQEIVVSDLVIIDELNPFAENASKEIILLNLKYQAANEVIFELL